MALAYRGIPLQSAYCAAKHAVQGFTESLRCELLHDGSGVHVAMVQLPALNTPQFSCDRAKAFSVQWWLNSNRLLVATVLAASTLGLLRAFKEKGKGTRENRDSRVVEFAAPSTP